MPRQKLPLTSEAPLNRTAMPNNGMHPTADTIVAVYINRAGRRVMPALGLLSMGINITSLETYFYKYLLPVTFVPWDGFRTVRASFPPNDPHAKTMWWVFLAAWCVIMPWVFWYAFRLKGVRMGEKALFVRSYRKEIQIPFSEVDGLKESTWPNIRHVTLRLKSPSEFGEKIVFIPKKTVETVAGKRSTIEELRGRIESAVK